MISQTTHNPMINNNRRLPVLHAVLVSVGIAACTTPREQVTQQEDNLAAAGFVVQPANKPQRQAMLNRLPSHHFVRREHGDSVS